MARRKREPTLGDVLGPRARMINPLTGSIGSPTRGLTNIQRAGRREGDRLGGIRLSQNLRKRVMKKSGE